MFRAVDSGGQTVDFYLSETRDREAAKCFLKRALAYPDNCPPQVFARDKLRSYLAAINPAHESDPRSPSNFHAPVALVFVSGVHECGLIST